MRILLCLAALMMLGGCNVVMTKTPLFAAADERGAPPMKPGLWRLDDVDCAVDESKPLAQWPECGNGAMFKPGEISGHDQKDGKPVEIHAPFILAAGKPRVAQIKLDDDRGGKGEPPYGYAAVEPLKFDSKGAIIEITYWLVQCGPPPSPKAKKPNGEAALGTLHPLPGMIMKPGDMVCETASKDALRGAAAASRAWEDKPAKHAHWVRATED